MAARADDAMAILAAFSESSRVKVLALTATYGNVEVETATRNACYLCDVTNCSDDVRVAAGQPGPVSKPRGERTDRIASFVHGDDGFGNTHVYNDETIHVDTSRSNGESNGGEPSTDGEGDVAGTTPAQSSGDAGGDSPVGGTRKQNSKTGPPSPSPSPSKAKLERQRTSMRPREKRMDGRAADQLIVDIVNEHEDNTVTILALGNLTNVCQAFRLDPTIPKRIKALYVLGGAFFTNGNVNPCAEANIHHDPVAADEVFGTECNCTVVGLDVTQQCVLEAEKLDGLAGVSDFLHNISKFYLEFHQTSSGAQKNDYNNKNSDRPTD